MRELSKESLSAWLGDVHRAFPDCPPAGDPAVLALQTDLLRRHCAVRAFIAQLAGEFGLDVPGVSPPKARGTDRAGIIERERQGPVGPSA